MGLLQRAEAMLHTGQASERNIKTASARVAMDDAHGLVSNFLQVLFPAIGGWNCYWTPKEGDHVLISRLPNGTQEGHILGKFYTSQKMPQGAAKNIILIVSDDGKNVIRFDADNGTLDLVVDQTADVRIKNLAVEVKENTDLVTDNLDVEAAKPIGFQGTGTQLGSDVLVAFFTDLKNAVTRNPIIIPPVPLPPLLPVPPVPVMINMFLKALTTAIALACDAAIIACKKALK